MYRVLITRSGVSLSVEACSTCGNETDHLHVLRVPLLDSATGAVALLSQVPLQYIDAEEKLQHT